MCNLSWQHFHIVYIDMNVYELTLQQNRLNRLVTSHYDALGKRKLLNNYIIILNRQKIYKAELY